MQFGCYGEQMVCFFDLLVVDIVQGSGFLCEQCGGGDGYCGVWDMVYIYIDCFEFVVGVGDEIVVSGDGGVYFFQYVGEMNVVLYVVVVDIGDFYCVVFNGVSGEEI